REIVRKPLSTFLLVDDAPARSDSFATCRCSFLFVLISSATIAFNLSTSSPPPARLRRVRVVFEPGGRPRRRGAFDCASSGAISLPSTKRKRAQHILAAPVEFLCKELRGGEHRLFGQTLQSLASKLVRGICFTADI